MPSEFWGFSSPLAHLRERDGTGSCMAISWPQEALTSCPLHPNTLAYRTPLVKRQEVRVVGSFTRHGYSRPQSFPRKRESTPQTLGKSPATRIRANMSKRCWGPRNLKPAPATSSAQFRPSGSGRSGRSGDRERSRAHPSRAIERKRSR